MRARTVCAADDGARIMRIRHFVQHDDKGFFVSFFRFRKDVVQRTECDRRTKRDDALMAGARRHKVQFAAVRALHKNALFARLFCDQPERMVGLAACDIYFIDVAAAFQRLADGIAPDHFFIFVRHNPYASSSTGFFGESSNLVNCGMNLSLTVFVSPLRCLAMISSVSDGSLALS